MPSPAYYRDALQPVSRELTDCAAAGCGLSWWWRDDDLVANTPALWPLLATSERFGRPVLIAVIPSLCKRDAALPLRAAPYVAIAQHGFAHVNHEPADRDKSEFGPARPLDAAIEDIAAGRAILLSLFGDEAVPVFVPPWNRLRTDAWPALYDLDIRGLSAYGRRSAAEAVPGVGLVNTHLDIVDWGARPVTLVSPDELAAKLAGMIRARREGRWPGDEPIGILTHHRAMDADCWNFIEALFSLTEHEAVQWLDARTAFALTAAP